MTSLEIRQESDGRSSLRPHRIAVGGFDLVDGKLVRTLAAELDIDGELTEVTEFVGKKRPALILLNDPCDYAYGKIRMDEESLRVAGDHLDAFEDHLARTQVLISTWNMCRDSLLGYRLLEDRAQGDRRRTDGTVLRIVLGNLGSAVNIYSDPTNRAALRLSVAERKSSRFSRRPSQVPDHQLQVASSAMRFLTTDEQLQPHRRLA